MQIRRGPSDGSALPSRPLRTHRRPRTPAAYSRRPERKSHAWVFGRRARHVRTFKRDVRSIGLIEIYALGVDLFTWFLSFWGICSQICSIELYICCRGILLGRRLGAPIKADFFTVPVNLIICVRRVTDLCMCAMRIIKLSAPRKSVGAETLKGEINFVLLLL